MLVQCTAALLRLSEESDTRRMIIHLLLSLEASKILASRGIMDPTVECLVEFDEPTDVAGNRCALHFTNESTEVFCFVARGSLRGKSRDHAF